jgi:hypothetical protein
MRELASAFSSFDAFAVATGETCGAGEVAVVVSAKEAATFER